MATDDLEPLLPDDRVGKIAELLNIAFPTLRGSDFFTFVVPPQLVLRNKPGIPHERGCPTPATQAISDCDCGPFLVPEQAVFAVRSDNPRASFDPVYRGKQFMTTSGMWRSVWDREEKARKHYVSTRDDPAWGPFYIAASGQARKMQDYKELI